jgi:hypothetical protein
MASLILPAIMNPERSGIHNVAGKIAAQQQISRYPGIKSRPEPRQASSSFNQYFGI